MRQFLGKILVRFGSALTPSASSFPGHHPHCVSHPTSRIYAYDCISNILGDPEAIRIGAYSHIRGELLTFGHGGSILIGDYCYVGANSRIWSAKEITIGDRVLISHDVSIFDNDTHPIDNPAARHAQYKAIVTTGHPRQLDLREKPVRIHDDALICCQTVILSGVSIGTGAVVGAGSIVTKDVPPMSVVAGNPARIIRRISNE